MFIPDPQRTDQGLIVLPNGKSVLYTEYDTSDCLEWDEMSPQEQRNVREFIYADMDDKGYFDDLDCSLQDGPPQPFNGDEPF